jgi:hypothetical protein
VVAVGNQTTYTLTGLTGGLTYTVAVTALDASTGSESSTSNSIAVPVPLAQADTVTDKPGTSATIAVLANDSDPNGNALNITAVTQGAHGTVTIQGTKLIYTPATGYVGTDSFTYIITNALGVSSTGTVTVYVISGNSPPIAVNDTVSISVGTSVTIAVLANDSDPNGYAFAITAVTQGAHGMVTVTSQANSVVYTPAANFVGTDSFTYTITDTRGASATATVTVNVLSDRAAFLVAAYSFNKVIGTTVSDDSGHGNTGSIGSAAGTTYGMFGGALVFNGTSAMVTIPDVSSLRLTTDMTLEAWVRPSTVTAAWRDVIYKGNDNYYLAATSNQTVPAGEGKFGTNAVVTYGTTALVANVWAHLAVTYDGAILRLYVNGAQVSSRAQTGNIATSTNPLQIGGDSIWGRYFHGTIDEVRIYNQALSPSEIQTDMITPIQ